MGFSRQEYWRGMPFPSPPGLQFSSVQFSSFAQSCPTLCNPMNRSTPSLPVHHQLRLPNSLTVKGWFKGKPEVLLNSGVLRPDNGREKVKGKGVSGYAAQWGKESACSAGNARDMGLIPRSGRSPGGRHGNPPQYSCLKNSMDRRSWQATVYRFTKIGTQLE